MIKNFILACFSVLVASYIAPGVTIGGLNYFDLFINIAVLVVVLALVNMILKPILTILTLPVNILSLGLFTFVINGILVLIADKMLSRFNVDTFWHAMLFAIILSLVQMVVNSLKSKEE